MPAARKPARKATQDRSIETRARLLESASAALREVGYRGTTVQEVATRAGVSLGALQYHFPTKHDLIVAAVEHVFERRVGELVPRLRALPGRARMARTIELLFSAYTEDTFTTYLELVVAGRTDEELRPHVDRMAHRLAERAISAFREVFSATEKARHFEDVLPSFFFATLEGLAIGRMASPGRGEYQRVLEALTWLGEEWLHPADHVPGRPT